ncbi:LysR family transcriptional regulator [Stappia sp. P2PMeth1]|uniref:LysR family transcriptional regulator n=1 Tax=Stappia sp. P2PMeth1 TaxID=2003586 RepID=UPI0016478983|nr:LysR family transcriptional regulator [Stappia sp. P2PMeth1]
MAIDTIRHLKYVLAVAEHGSMRQVAQALGVKESTVSRKIAAIEQHLDIQLFNRFTSGVQLTEEGSEWLDAVRGHYDGLEEILTQTANRKKDADKLRIGLSSPVGREFLIRLIERFQNTHPEIEVTFRDASCSKHAAAIRHRHLDVAFMCGCCPAKACKSETIWQERLSALLPADHALAENSELTWNDLAGERLLVPMGTEGPLLDACFLARLGSGPHPPIIERCNASQATVIVKVQLGKGFTLTGESFANAVTIEAAIWRPIVGNDGSCPINAVWLESNPKRSVLRFVAIARNMAAEGT